MATIEINNTQAKSIAAQSFSEVSDEDFEKLFKRIVREAKYRRNVDFPGLVRLCARTWGEEKVRVARSAKSLEDSM